jgi:hypothetical protein
VSDVLRSYDEFFPLSPERKEDVRPARAWFEELLGAEAYLFKKVLHFVRVLDQGINRSREQVLHTLKLARDTNWLWLLTIYVEQGWAYGCKIKWEQLWEGETLKKRQRLACHRERKVQIKQKYDILFPGKDW